jgi:hypothetical protein
LLGKKQEARSKKQEARSKKQEARSKKQEARSKKQEARVLGFEEQYLQLGAVLRWSTRWKQGNSLM